MSAEPRRAGVRALAKINLLLKVLNRRPDGYHELRTVFQTVSLADRLDISFTPGRKSSVKVVSTVDIPGTNLAARAAEAALEAMGRRGAVEIRLVKKIPMGGGLGGGSTDAAAVLLALPALARAPLAMDRLAELGSSLGSDVPFFLLGGTAVALGRGTELYPLPDFGAPAALLVAPGEHVSTAEAYAALQRELTLPNASSIINTFQSLVWSVASRFPGERGSGPLENDFEDAVFRRHPRLRSIQVRLRKLGARPAMMTGSGSVIFGIFASRDQARRAGEALRGERVFPVSFVRRSAYRAMWRRSLGAGAGWPPLCE